MSSSTDEELIKRPDRLKMLVIADMKRLKYKFTRALLTKYGFSDAEIEYLIENNEVKLT